MNATDVHVNPHLSVLCIFSVRMSHKCLDVMQVQFFLPVPT